MEKDLAKELMELATSLDGTISKMFDVVERIEDAELRGCFKRAVGDLMGVVARDFIFPIESVHPDLNPDGH